MFQHNDLTLVGRGPICGNAPWSTSFGGVDVVVGGGWTCQCQMEADGKGVSGHPSFFRKCRAWRYLAKN